jgi:hypothetical protein
LFWGLRSLNIGLLLPIEFKDVFSSALVDTPKVF